MTTDAGSPAALRRLDASEAARRRVAVIGGGVIGLSTAYAAARIGGDAVRVDLYESATVGHEGAASADASRGFRHVYGDQELYARWAREALDLWRLLQQASGQTLYDPCGNVWIAHRGESAIASAALGRTLSTAAAHEFVEQSHRMLRALDIPCELFDGADFRRRYPQFADPDIAVALLDTRGGMLFARRALLALRDLCRQAGVGVHEGARAVEVVQSGGACGIAFADGTSVEADAVVLAVGGWTGQLLPGLAERITPRGADVGGWWERGLQLTEEPLYYLAPGPSLAEQFQPRRFPVFLFSSIGVYGAPLHEGVVKVGDGNPARLLHAPEGRRLADAAYRERVIGTIGRQIPALRDAALVAERTCFFDLTPDGDFILDRWDAEARLIVACGFSGHGFKFGPLIGARLARYALTGRPPEDLARFGLDRFALGATA